MQCPQCGVETPEEELNCVGCEVNLFWAARHYEELVALREQEGLPARPLSAPFLIEAHKRAIAERAERGEAGRHTARKDPRNRTPREA